MMMGFFQPGTRRGMRGMTMGSLKTVPPNAFRIVPLGDSHTVFHVPLAFFFSIADLGQDR